MWWCPDEARREADHLLGTIAEEDDSILLKERDNVDPRIAMDTNG